MSSVDGMVSTQVALTQAQLQTEVAARMLKVANSIGNPIQMVELVKQAADAASETMNAAVEGAIGQLDEYA